MAKIILNNKEFNIDDAVIASINEGLKNHLLTTMAGEGATITLDGVTYNVDSTKLSTATNNFISHLGTISGSGAKIKVGNVEYSVDATKITGAMSELETGFGELEAGGSGDSDSVVGTWQFNYPPLTRGCPMTMNITFTTNANYHYTDYTDDEENGVDKETNSFISMFTPYANTLNFNINESFGGQAIGMSDYASWFDGIIHITGGDDITNETFITWLNENATKVA